MRLDIFLDRDSILCNGLNLYSSRLLNDESRLVAFPSRSFCSSNDLVAADYCNQVGDAFDNTSSPKVYCLASTMNYGQ